MLDKSDKLVIVMSSLYTILTIFQSFFVYLHVVVSPVLVLSADILQMCLLTQAIVLGIAASVECHKYFPLFRNGFGVVAGEKEGGEDG